MKAIIRKAIYLNLALLVMFMTAFLLFYTAGLNDESVTKNRQSDVLGDRAEISAVIYSCELTLTVKPEARTVGNFSTDIVVTIFDENEAGIGSFSTTTDSNGVSTTNLCDQGIYLVGGSYVVKIKGLSHLNSLYNVASGFNLRSESIDFSADGSFLIAGEVGNIDDGEINSLDITNQIRTLYKNSADTAYDRQFDLDLDNDIDIEDLDVTIKNFYLTEPVL